MLGEPGVYERLEALAHKVAEGLRAAAAQGDRPVTLNQVGAMMTLFFCEGPVASFADARHADTAAFAAYWRHMLERGVYLAPSQFESTMVSLALTDDDIARRRSGGGRVLRGLSGDAQHRQEGTCRPSPCRASRCTCASCASCGRAAWSACRPRTSPSMIDLNAAQIRKDFSYFGEFGTRGVGYEVDRLVDEITRCLGLDQTWNVVIVGAGLLGTALARYRGFTEQGFRLVGMFDSSATVIGASYGSGRVRSVADLEEFCRTEQVDIAMVTVPAAEAQATVDRLAAAGVSAILNFAPVKVHSPEGVLVRQVDLSSELMFLSFYLDGERQREWLSGTLRSRPAWRPPTAFGPPRPRAPALRWGPLFAALDGSWDDDYVHAVELIYEGYLLHYRESRVLRRRGRRDARRRCSPATSSTRAACGSSPRAATPTPSACSRVSWRPARTCAARRRRSPPTTPCGRPPWAAWPPCARGLPAAPPPALFDEVDAASGRRRAIDVARAGDERRRACAARRDAAARASLQRWPVGHGRPAVRHDRPGGDRGSARLHRTARTRGRARPRARPRSTRTSRWPRSPTARARPTARRCCSSGRAAGGPRPSARPCS